MMVAEVRRVSNPRKVKAKAKPRKKAAAGRSKAKSKGKRVKRSPKQIKFFGTKAQKAALKRKRSRSAARPKATAKRNGSARKAPVVVVVRKAAPKKRTAKRKTAKKKNPIQAITLGFVNPYKKGRKTMAKKAKKRSKRSYKTSGKRRALTMAPRKSRTMKKNGRRYSSRKRNRNPFGSGLGTQETMKYVIGLLVGVAVTKAGVPMLPFNTSSQPLAIAGSIGVAFAAGWLASKFDPKMGQAVLFGGLAQAASVFLSSYIPPVGNYLALRGGRGVGEFVPASFTVPQNPISMAAGGGGGGYSPTQAYRRAY
jgi:hypothetical protein